MKRKAAALTLIATLLFLTISEVQFIFITAANFVIYYEIPTKPDTNPPLVTVNSPTQNQTFDSQNIILNFTVTKPKTWISLSRYSDTVHLILGNITSFYYAVDGVESQSVLVQDISSVYSDNPQQTLEFSLNLTLPEGYHSLFVGVEGETRYRQAYGSIMEPLSSNMVHGVSEVINFTIVKPPEPEPEPFPTMVLAPFASVAFVGVGLMVYLKRKR